MLELFVEAGAPEEILYENKPHLGTDQLIGIVTRMRKEIEDLGGEVRFGCRVTDLLTDRGKIRGVSYEQRQTADRVEEQELRTDVVVLAIGHSARDTFSMLKEKGIPMQAKSFAVGVRMEHPQHMINESQYGKDYPAILPAAAYKVTRQTGGGRGVYSFCMCPGGVVTASSSEENTVVTNGMSYYARNGENANSAVLV